MINVDKLEIKSTVDFPFLNSERYKFSYSDFIKIQHDVEEVIKYSQDFSCNINANELMLNWFQAKKSFINNFLHGKLIYQVPEKVTFKLDEESKKRRIHEFADYILTHYNNTQLASFLFDLDIEDFYNNKTSQNYIEYSIPKDFKVIKAFKFFIKNKNLLQELQDKASQIIQENCITGYLCFSVHPLDYLSASENVHNWRSCHALDGEYRTGNLNYMMDSSTIICYLKSEKDEKLPHFPESVPWNSKKWRVWIYFSAFQDMVFLGRQYPFFCQTGVDFIRKFFLTEDKWSKFYSASISSLKDPNTKITFYFDTSIPIRNVLRPINKIVKNGELTWHYNDILRSSHYKPLYAFSETIDLDILWQDIINPAIKVKRNAVNENTYFTIGHKCKCPICNESYLKYSDKMACSDCIEKYDLYSEDDFVECYCCGAQIVKNQAHYIQYSNNYYCDRCYNTELVTCDCCGRQGLPDTFIYNEQENIYLCPNHNTLNENNI